MARGSSVTSVLHGGRSTLCSYETATSLVCFISITNQICHVTYQEVVILTTELRDNNASDNVCGAVIMALTLR